MVHSQKRGNATIRWNRDGVTYVYRVSQRRAGLPRDRWVATTRKTRVEVFPPWDYFTGWMVAVDGVVLLDIESPRGKALAFGAADAFAVQNVPLDTVLKENQYTKDSNTRKRQRRRARESRARWALTQRKKRRR